jgi:hypothetical protein
VICDFISFLHLISACGAFDCVRCGTRVEPLEDDWRTYLRRRRRADCGDAFAAEAVPAGPNQRRAPLGLHSPEIEVATTALKLLIAEREIRGIPLRRRKDRVALAAPLVSTRKENQLIKLGFFPSRQRDGILLSAAAFSCGGIALVFDAVSAQRVTTAENEGRPLSFFLVHVVHS